MGVYIKGMDMPKSCHECELFINCDDCEGFETQCAILGQLGYLVDIPKDFRHQNCPLVEVKAPHGDVIDRDALLFDNSEAFHDIDGYTNAAWEAVDNAQIVIEAEGKDDG